MCLAHDTPKKEMGFDASLLKSVLEQFVDEIGEESIDLIVDRPRFAHAVVVVADEDRGELCQASCIRQLDDVVLYDTHVANVDAEWMDEEIQRALRELTESKELLETPRNSVMMEEKNHNHHHHHHHTHRSTTSTTTTTTKTSTSSTEEVTSSDKYNFPSMSRAVRREQ